MSDYVTSISEKLRLDQLDNNPNLFFIPQHLGIKPSSLVVAIIIFTIIVTLTSNASNIVVGLACCLIPCYFTFISLQSSNRQDDIKYLTYWILYSMVQTLSPMLRAFLPTIIYVGLRIGLTLALLHPTTNLTIKVYKDYVQPVFKQYENTIDRGIQNTYQKGKNVAQEQYKKFTRN